LGLTFAGGFAFGFAFGLDFALGLAFARGRAFFFMEGNVLFAVVTGSIFLDRLRTTYRYTAPSLARNRFSTLSHLLI
jgi:hypothetical protein